MNKQVIPASWHCNGLCAGLQIETFVPVLLDIRKSRYLQGFFELNSHAESPADVNIPSSFPPIATFFNCSCLNIKRLLSGKDILVKFPVTVDLVQIKLFYCDNVVKEEALMLTNNHNDSADHPQQLDDSLVKSPTVNVDGVSTDSLENQSLAIVPISKVSHSPIRITESIVKEAVSPQNVSKTIGDISSSEGSDDEGLDEKILKEMKEVDRTSSPTSEESIVKAEVSDNRYDNIEDLVVYNTDVRKKRSALPTRTQPRRKPSANQNKLIGNKRSFMLESSDVAPKRKAGRPSKAFMLAKKTAEIKFKNLAQPVVREAKGPTDNTLRGASKNKVQGPSKEDTTEQNGSEVNAVEKPEASIEHPPIVERNAIDLVRRKLQFLKGKRSKDPEPNVENLFVENEEEKPLFTMDDNFFNNSSNADLVVLSGTEQDTSAYIFSPAEDSNNLAQMQDEIEPSSATSSISSEGALVVHDILFDDLMNTSRVIAIIFVICTIIHGSDQEVMKFMSNFSAAQPQSIWRPSILLYFFPLLIIALAATRTICTDCHLIYGQ